MELAWLVVGSLAIGTAQLAAMVQHADNDGGMWAELAQISPPLDSDRPMGGEVRRARDLMHAADTALYSAKRTQRGTARAA